jgi:hypothetical protein
VNHTVRLTDVHDIRNSNNFARSKAILRITREALVELQEHLRVGRSPGIDLPDVGITAGCSADVVCAMDETWHTLVEARPEGSMEMVDRVCQMRAVSKRRLRDVALTISRGVRRSKRLHRLAAFQRA